MFKVQGGFWEHRTANSFDTVVSRTAGGGSKGVVMGDQSASCPAVTLQVAKGLPQIHTVSRAHIQSSPQWSLPVPIFAHMVHQSTIDSWCLPPPSSLCHITMDDFLRLEAPVLTWWGGDKGTQGRYVFEGTGRGFTPRAAMGSTFQDCP